MAVDAELLEILACPDCKGKVKYVESDEVIICTECGLRYPVRDDIPVMLVEEAERAEPPPASSGDATEG